MSENEELRIVPYEPSHLDAILALSLRAWAPVFASMEAAMPKPVFSAFYPQGWEVGQSANVEVVCKDRETAVWVALIADKVVGFLGTRIHEDNPVGEIYIIAVDPDHQRRGIGAELTTFAFDQMRKAGLSIAMVETGSDQGHAPARRAYESAGFSLWPVARYFRQL